MPIRRTVSGLLGTVRLTRPVFAVRFFFRRLKPSVVGRMVHYRITGTPDGLPLPSTSARVRVAGSADPAWFIEGGRLAAVAIRHAVARQRRDMREFERILDFGCGCGRLLRHWRGLPGVGVFGTDMQLPLLRECRRLLPFAHLAVNGPEPPLPFVDSSFDLVCSLSVFTHLDGSQQLLWRDEIFRILKPNGLWLLTTQGETYMPKLSPEERERFVAGEVVCQRSEFRGLNLCQAFHPEAYVRTTLADGFTVLDYEREGARGNPRQDLYVLLRAPLSSRQGITTTQERSAGKQRVFVPTCEQVASAADVAEA